MVNWRTVDMVGHIDQSDVENIRSYLRNDDNEALLNSEIAKTKMASSISFVKNADVNGTPIEATKG